MSKKNEWDFDPKFFTKVEAEMIPVKIKYWKDYYENILIELKYWEFEKNDKGSVTGHSQKWYTKLVEEVKAVGNYIKKREAFAEYKNNICYT
jgi:hypothetical protein